MKNPEKESKRQ